MRKGQYLSFLSILCRLYQPVSIIKLCELKRNLVIKDLIYSEVLYEVYLIWQNLVKPQQNIFSLLSLLSFCFPITIEMFFNLLSKSHLLKESMLFLFLSFFFVKLARKGWAGTYFVPTYIPSAYLLCTSLTTHRPTHPATNLLSTIPLPT